VICLSEISWSHVVVDLFNRFALSDDLRNLAVSLVEALAFLLSSFSACKQ
jgi:hypothetical protein